MNVVHLLGCPIESGAGRGVFALHTKLRELGCNSIILGRIEHTPKDASAIRRASTLSKVPSGILSRYKRMRLEREVGKIPPNFEPVTSGLNLHHYPEYKNADIIHVQWANGRTFSKSTWSALANERRPVFWTLRDMWPFTGGCHFSGGCTRYTQECGNCPQLGGQSESRTTQDLAFKAQHYSSIKFLTISNYFADIASKSLAMQNEIRVIPNSINLLKFEMFDKKDARDRLGLPQDSFLFCAGAVNFGEERKGGKVIAKMMQSIGSNTSTHLVVFGSGYEAFVGDNRDQITNFGMVRDDVKLNLIYAAADAYLMPSTEESFGKTIIEAMASGTPVLAYADTPADDIIDRNTGYTVPYKDEQAFIEKALDISQIDRDILVDMGKKSRDRVTNHFSSDKVARQHLDLYCSSL